MIDVYIKAVAKVDAGAEMPNANNVTASASCTNTANYWLAPALCAKPLFGI